STPTCAFPAASSPISPFPPVPRSSSSRSGPRESPVPARPVSKRFRSPRPRGTPSRATPKAFRYACAARPWASRRVRSVLGRPPRRVRRPRIPRPRSCSSLQEFACARSRLPSRSTSRFRARWRGGHLKLLFTGFVDLLKIAAKSPKGAFVLAADLWLRPRLFVLLALAFLAVGADIALLFFSSKGAWRVLFLLVLSLEAKLALVFEGLSVVALRRHIGTPPEIPAVTLSDLFSSLAMWARAAGRALLAPSRWHRARPPA